MATSDRHLPDRDLPDRSPAGRNPVGRKPAGRGSADRNPSGKGPKNSREVFVISVAAEITGMHAQTLRTYDRIGLVSPERTRGGGRRYSRDDIDQLLEIQRLSHEEGVNLAGIKTIIDQQNQIRALERDNAVLQERLVEMQAEMQRLAAVAKAATQAGRGASARSRGEIVHVPRSTAVVMWEPRRGRREN